MKLGERLVRDGAIDRAQLLSALREQILVGGRLGSQLVALDHISDRALARVLAEITGVPSAQGESTPEARALVDELTARRERALPMSLEEGPRRLVCALADPSDERALTELARVARVDISPRVQGAGWILERIDRLYAPAEVHAASEAGAVHGARAANRMTRPIRLGNVVPPHLRVLPIAPIEGQKLLDAATGREQIGEALVAFCRGRLDSAILFTVRGGRAVGWKGQGPGIDGEALDQIALGPEAGKLLTDPLLERRTFRARHRLPAALTMMGTVQGPKGEVVAIPGLFEDRVVTVLVGTTRGPAEESMARALEQNALAASAAYARLIALLEEPAPVT